MFRKSANNRIKELEKKYEELGKEIERLKKEQETVEFKNDPIFLLSKEEYEEYKDKIPKINCCWWLKSPGYSPKRSACVNYGGVGDFGYDICDQFTGVRPALNLQSPVVLAYFTKNLLCGETHKTRLMDIVNKDTIVFCGVTWIKIDKYLYISELPIDFRRFDNKSNIYETSEVRKFLLFWFEERAELN